MTIKRSAMMIFLMMVLLVFTGCDVLGTLGGNDESGSLFIWLSDGGVESRTLLPELSMDIASYTISGVGPDDAVFEETVSGTDSFLQNDLLKGDWTITVDAYNDETTPVKIGTGSAEITIEPAQINEGSVIVRPITGNGSFELLIDWDSVLADPSLVFNLTNADDQTATISETFTITDQEGALYIPSLANGYYLLDVTLYDGENTLGYAIETLRIVSDEPTTGLLSVITDPTGELSLTITEMMDDPIEVTLSGVPELLFLGTEMTVTAATSEVVDAYAWYLNGDKFVGETIDTITFGSDLIKGDYQLTCVVWKDNVICSSRVEFSAGDGITRAQLIEMIDNGEDVTQVSTSVITDMSDLFRNNTTFNQDISGWDVSNVTDMSNMFNGAESFNQDLSGWDAGNVTDHDGFSSGECPLYYDYHPLESWGDATDLYSTPVTRAELDTMIANGDDVTHVNTSEITDMSDLFRDNTTFNQNISGWDVSNVINMEHMFNNASSFNQDISDWVVSNVINMEHMFYYASSFNQDIGRWNVGNVTDMSYMFGALYSFNQDLSGWDVSNVTDMEYMFGNAREFDQDISGWDVSNVKNMRHMFFIANEFNQDISDWDVSNVTNMSGMFESAKAFNQDISDWDVSNVTNMSGMFDSAKAFNQDISDWNVSNVTNMARIFFNAISFNGDISDWDVSNVKDFERMFYYASSFNQDISDWDVSSVTNMDRMFSQASNFNRDISDWDVSKVRSMGNMFDGASSFNKNISDWDVSNVWHMSWMFNHATSFNQDLSDWDVSSVLNHHQFSDNFCPLYRDYHPLESWADSTDIYHPVTRSELDTMIANGEDVAWVNTSEITDMSELFRDNSSFNQDISDWNVGNVTNMENMFRNATSFSQNLSDWDVSNVTNMAGMFRNTSSFNQDISDWDVSNVTTMGSMFKENTSFNKSLSGWDVSNVTAMYHMFRDATSFNQNIASWDVRNVTTMSCMFYGASSFNKNISGWDVSNVTSYGYFSYGSCPLYTSYHPDPSWN